MVIDGKHPCTFRETPDAEPCGKMARESFRSEVLNKTVAISERRERREAGDG